MSTDKFEDAADPCRLGTYTGQEVLERVKLDPMATPVETETSFHFTKDRDVARLTVTEPGLMRRVLAHPFATVITVTVEAEGNRRPALAPPDYDGRPIVHVEAAVPLSVPQLLTSTPRTHSQHADLATERVLDREWRQELVGRFPEHIGRLPQGVRDR